MQRGPQRQDVLILCELRCMQPSELVSIKPAYTLHHVLAGMIISTITPSSHSSSLATYAPRESRNSLARAACSSAPNGKIFLFPVKWVLCRRSCTLRACCNQTSIHMTSQSAGKTTSPIMSPSNSSSLATYAPRESRNSLARAACSAVPQPQDVLIHCELRCVQTLMHPQSLSQSNQHTHDITVLLAKRHLPSCLHLTAHLWLQMPLESRETRWPGQHAAQHPAARCPHPP